MEVKKFKSLSILKSADGFYHIKYNSGKIRPVIKTIQILPPEASEWVESSTRTEMDFQMIKKAHKEGFLQGTSLGENMINQD